MPINIKPGEGEEEFISRCIADEVSAGYPTDQAAAICYAYYRKDKMSRMDTPSKVMARVKFDADFRGINLAEDGLEGACWDGYEAIGTKILDGREVPNCVPIKE